MAGTSCRLYATKKALTTLSASLVLALAGSVVSEIGFPGVAHDAALSSNAAQTKYPVMEPQLNSKTALRGNYRMSRGHCVPLLGRTVPFRCVTGSFIARMVVL